MNMPVESRDEIRCPTCGARQVWSDVCRRCKCDLRLLRRAAEAYDQHRQEALRLLNAGIADLALDHARSCHRLNPGAESDRLLALCYLVQEDWGSAIERARAVVEPAAKPAI
jgi:hypothetical protein